MTTLIEHLIDNDIPYTKSPVGLTVESYLDISHTNISELPDNLTVEGSMHIRCTPISSLPASLTVWSWLDISHTNISELPDNLNVGGSIGFDPETQLQDVSTYRHKCGRRYRTLIALLLNNEVVIIAGCFTGPLAEFETRVRDEYDQDPGTTYINHARELVTQLAVKMGIYLTASAHKT